MRSEVDPKETYRRIIEAISRGDPDMLERLIAPGVVDHNPIPGQAPGLEGFKQWMASARASFPDLQGSVEDVIGEGDRVAARMTWNGTHQGDFVGVPPTNRRVAMTAFHHVRFEGGRAAEWWGTADLLGALQQVGATIAAPET
jgi:steroid delta-isomerase-like uncharacterized protein